MLNFRSIHWDGAENELGQGRQTSNGFEGFGFFFFFEISDFMVFQGEFLRRWGIFSEIGVFFKFDDGLKKHIEFQMRRIVKNSSSTSPSRGNQVDGLPRAASFADVDTEFWSFKPIGLAPDR